MEKIALRSQDEINKEYTEVCILIGDAYAKAARLKLRAIALLEEGTPVAPPVVVLPPEEKAAE